MKKFPRKFQYPLMMSMVLPSMLLGMPAIMAYRKLSGDMSFLETWLSAVAEVVPSGLMLLAIVAPLVRLLVTRILIEPEQA